MTLRALLAAALVLLNVSAFAQTTPTFNSLTLTGPLTVGGSVVLNGSQSVSGTSSLNGGGALIGTFSGQTMLSNVLPTLTNYTVATLPAAPAIGTVAVATDCRNGSQAVGAGTGCVEVFVNGAWQAMPSPPNQPITVGGQSVYNGGSAVSQGTGSAIQTANGSFTSGHVPQYDATGALIDSGSGPGGGGGSGSVSNCATGNSPAIYASSGTTVTCVAGANSSVLVTGNTGTISLATTLPSGLTVPAPVMTGTGTFVALTGSGALTTAASAVGGANFNIPQGTAPSSPANGNVWATSAGLFGRYNGTTYGPYIGIAQLSATSPIVDTSGVFSCATCATTTNGGALTATSPMAISAGGVISLGEFTVAIPIIWNATTTVTNDSYQFYWPQATGHITSVKYYTGGSSTPSFTINVAVNGSSVTGCSAISVTAANSQASPGTTTCTSTAITSGQPIKISTSGVAGTPFSAMVEVIGTRSAS